MIVSAAREREILGKPMGEWCLIICGVAFVAGAVTCGILIARRKPLLTTKVLEVATFSTSRARGDWYVRLSAAFKNRSSDAVSIESVSFQVISQDGRRLMPNEICGDRRKALGQRHHPPRLTMRLPILVPAKGGVDYTFDVFFDRNLQSYWGNGCLKMTSQVQAGTSSAVETRLCSPEQGRGATTET